MSYKQPKRRVNQTGRDQGGGRFVCLYEYMLRSDAWQSISQASRSLYIEFGRLYNGRNNGDLFLSEREAAKRIGVNPKTASKALKELEDRGFIRALQRGSFKWKARHATQWVLTEHPHGNNLPTKEFMRWTSKTESQSHILEPTAPLCDAESHSNPDQN